MAAALRDSRTIQASSNVMFLLILVGVVVVSGLAVYGSSYIYRGQSPGGPGLLRASCKSISNNASVVHTASGGAGGNAYFLIVETDPPSHFAGINGSYSVQTTTQWPILHVRMGQNVSIHIINCASSEAHGFQVQYYDDRRNTSIQPGQSYDVSFVATKAGTFRIYCNIYCAIHAFMQNGAMIVT